MRYVAVYQIDKQLEYLEFEASEWCEVYGKWLELRPAYAILRTLSEREKFDWQILGNGVEMWLGTR